MKQPFDDLPDLPKSDPLYLSHRTCIESILDAAHQRKQLVQDTLHRTERRLHQEGRSTKLPHFSSVIRPEHVNCKGVQILFHHLGMESYRREYDEKEEATLRPLLRRVASIRLSMMQAVPPDFMPKDFEPEIEELDILVKEAVNPSIDPPSLTPYLFKPHTAISQSKKLLQDEKFRHPEILLQLGELYIGDDHVLHSVCMSLIQEQKFGAVQALLEDRSRMLFPQFKTAALTPLFQTRPGLFSVHIIALVEGGKTDEATKWCERQFFRPLLVKNTKLAEKYATALRHRGMFEKAMQFLEECRDQHGLMSKDLRVQYSLARARDSRITAGSLEEFRRQQGEW